MTPKISLGALDLDAAEVHLLVSLKADDFGRSVFMRHVAHGIFLAEASPPSAMLGCALTLRDGRWERARVFSELVSHYLVKDRFGRPGEGNDKGKVEGLVKYARANFMTPVPVAATFDALNAMLSGCCLARQSERAGRHSERIGERLVAASEALERIATL